MKTINRIEVLASLGHRLDAISEDEMQQLCQNAFEHNRWFEPSNVRYAVESIRTAFLDSDKLAQWIQNYKINDEHPKKIGLVLAGNIPAVGWHDIMCCFLSGNIALIKYSEKDNIIIPFLLDILQSLAPEFAYQWQVVDRLSEFDAVIATGSDNSARYFESYFGKYPHIIRKNRHAIAVLNGGEDDEALRALGTDIFTYFGLGCRNVSKLYVPRGYNFNVLLEILHENNNIVVNNKYKNNFDYNIALYLLNKESYLNNGCVILLEKEALTSRIASLHYEYYDDAASLEQSFIGIKDQIQCIVGSMTSKAAPVFPFGKAQQPALNDYADGVDTMAFLTNLG